MNLKEIIKDDWIPMAILSIIWLANGLYIRHLSITRGEDVAFNYTFPIGGLILLTTSGLICMLFLRIAYRGVKYSFNSTRNIS